MQNTPLGVPTLRETALMPERQAMTRSAGLIPDLPNTAKNLLLTGLPGCGKTTVVRRVAERLGDLRVAGFLSLELREHGQRVGFEAIDLSGQRAILAHVRSRSPTRYARRSRMSFSNPPATTARRFIAAACIYVSRGRSFPPAPSRISIAAGAPT